MVASSPFALEQNKISSFKPDFLKGSNLCSLSNITTKETSTISNRNKDKRRSFEYRPLKLSQHRVTRTVSGEPSGLALASVSTCPGTPLNPQRAHNRRSIQSLPSIERRTSSSSSTRPDYFSQHSRAGSSHQLIDSPKSLNEVTSSCRHCQVFTHRIEQLEKVLDTCVEGAAFALEIERNLRLEIEGRVLELLLEISELKASAGQLVTMPHDEDEDEHDRTIRRKPNRRRPEIWSSKSESYGDVQLGEISSGPFVIPRRRSSHPNLSIHILLPSQNPNRRSFLAATLSRNQPGTSESLRSIKFKADSSTFVDTSLCYDSERALNPSVLPLSSLSRPATLPSSPTGNRPSLTQKFMRRASQRIVESVANIFMADATSR